MMQMSSRLNDTSTIMEWGGIVVGSRLIECLCSLIIGKIMDPWDNIMGWDIMMFAFDLIQLYAWWVPFSCSFPISSHWKELFMMKGQHFTSLVRCILIPAFRKAYFQILFEKMEDHSGTSTFFKGDFYSLCDI